MRKLKLEELGRLTLNEYKSTAKLRITVVADNIRSGLNIGSLFRTCDAFGLEEIVLCGISASPPHKEINKTAIGADMSVNWRHCEDISTELSRLKEDGYQIVVIEQTNQSTPLSTFEIESDQKIAVVFGNEVDGASLEALDLADQAVDISQYGTKHSLNVSVCAGIVLWHLANQLRS